MKLSLTLALGLVTLAAATPVIHEVDAADNNNVEKRFFNNWPKKPTNKPSFPKQPTNKPSIPKQPKPTFPAWPQWPQFGNSTTTSVPKTTSKTTSETTAKTTAKTTVKTTAKTTSKLTPTKTATPTKPTPTKPTPTSPEAAVSAIASGIQDLLQDIYNDVNNIISSIDKDFSSIFGGFPFFKRDGESDAGLEARDELPALEARSFNETEVEEALSTLVTNVFGHLLTLTNNTNVSLAQSLLAALQI
ncbi:hypothetical protein OY671_005873 [Metschnikowia pulcherrima]|nr:hypothetical protein OY671_005873 [Metschnikowia pulcherrima]